MIPVAGVFVGKIYLKLVVVRATPIVVCKGLLAVAVIPPAVVEE